MIKLSNFRVRDRLNIKNKAENHAHEKEENHPEDYISNILKNDDLKVSSLLQSFESIITSLANSNVKKSTGLSRSSHGNTNFTRQIDYRDRFVTIEIPDFEGTKIDFKKLQKWVGEVCHESLSVAFHYFMEKKLNYDQMKVFASQNFLRNLAVLAENYKLTSEEIKFIDHTMKEKILPYLKAKYPLTVEKEVNKSLNKAVKSIDNSEIPTNDYFYTSEIQFEYRQNGRYDDIIMRFLNEIMTKIDQKDQQNEDTNYKKFKKLMKQVFEKSFDEQWIETGKSSSEQNNEKIIKEKQKYEEKVKSYTSYSINRKISENTQLYTEQEIKDQNISIKSPAVLRILTKWCEQLWHKFEDDNYFMKRNDEFVMVQTKIVGLLTPYTKEVLTKHAKKQKQSILQFLKKLENINYEQQVQLLENQLADDEGHYIQKYQRVSGKFACKIVNSIETFIINYLNLLIHSLINVSKPCFEQYQCKYPSYWQARFNLVSFNVSDLLRCKYSSKEKEVLKIFNQIERINNENPEKLKIVRIKNRLKNATNDIMINIKFNNSINCEIQIAVNATHSEFMNCSNKINHYIYEIERAQFGPILEICSIWKTYEKRSQVFNRLISLQKPRKKMTKSHEQCLKNADLNPLIPIIHPFVCSQCSKHYYQNNYIVSHQKCNSCEYWKCAVCTIKQNFKAQNRQFFFKENVYKSDYKFWKQKGQVPVNGACIFINRPEINVLIFKKIQHNFKQYLIHQKDGQSVVLRELSQAKDYDQFFKDCLIFKLNSNIVNEQVRYESKKFEQDIKVNLLLPSFIQKCLKQEKQSISIIKDPIFKKVNMNDVVSKYRDKCKFVKNLDYYDSGLTNLDNLLPDFVNLTTLNFSANLASDISRVCEFPKLQKLYINSMSSYSLPSQIGKLQKLQQFKAYNNRLQELPQSFSLLSSLKFLNLNDNKFQKWPDKMDQLINLKELSINQNQLTQFPQMIGKLNRLELLNMKRNQLQKMPGQLKGFSSLKYLDLSNNRISNLPTIMNELTKLKIIDIDRNKIQQIPSSIGSLKSLQQLKAVRNIFNKIPDELGNLVKLTLLDLSTNKLTSMNPCVFKLVNLTVLNIADNQIQEIEDSFDKLPKLKQLRININKLKILPPSLKKCPLKHFQFAQNPLEEFQIQLYRTKPNDEFKIQNCKSLKNISCSQILPHQNDIKRISFSINSLQQYPGFVAQFKNLQTLELHKNQLKQIPDTFKNDNKLTKYQISFNQLYSLPPSFTCLKLLKILYLSQNNFEIFPEQICQLTNLETLDVHKNKLKQLPENIKNLKKLKNLSINENQIEKIPAAIGELVSLQVFYAKSNKIKQIPLEMCKNQSIKELDLETNMIQKIPKQIEKMIGLLKNVSKIQGNPIKEVENEQFVALKFRNWINIRKQLDTQNSLITHHARK